MKGGRLLAEVFQRRGYTVQPPPCNGQTHTPVASFITAIRLGNPAAMQAFCKAVQQKSPVGSYVMPIPGAAPLISGTATARSILLDSLICRLSSGGRQPVLQAPVFLQ